MILRVLLSAAILLSLASNVGAQPVFSAPQVLPGDDVIGLAAGQQSNAVIARGGDQYLVVWVDDSSSYGGDQTDLDIFGTRVDLNGDPIDATPFPIANGYGYQRDPQIAWNGASWLVTYEAQVATQFFYENTVQAVRVDPQGQVVDPAPITIFGQGSGGSFELAPMANQWVIVSQSHDAGSGGLKARRLGADGQFLDPAPVTLVPPLHFLYTYTVLSTDTELLLGWTPTSGGSSKVAQRYDVGLVPIGGQFPLPLATVTSNGTSYYATWTVGANYVGSPMATDGTLQIPSGVVLGPTYQTYPPKMAWAETQWWASWTQINQGFKVTRVTPAGAVLDPGGVLVPESETATTFLLNHGSAGGSAGELLIVYTQNGSGFTSSYDVVGIPIDAAVQVGAPVTMCRSAPHQQRPHLAAGPSQFLASFVSEVSGERRAMIQRIGTDGVAIDAEPTQVASGEFVGSIRAAWNGAVYLVAWSDNGEVQGRRLLPDGTWLDAAPFHVLTGGAPDVAALGRQFLVVGQFSPSIQFLYPVAQAIDGLTGGKVGASLTLGFSFAQAVRVATVGGRWLVTWQRNYSHDDPQAQAEAAFVDENGLATSSFVVAYNGFTPAVATRGDDGAALFVYRTGSLPAANNDIGARLMLADGTFPADGFVVTAAAYKQMAPAVAFDGDLFLAAWEDRRDDEAFFDWRTNVYGARIDADGQLLDPASFPIETAPEGEARPALASLDGTTLYASSTFHDDPGYASWRIATRTTGDCVGAMTPYGDACPGSGGYLPSLSATGCPLSGDEITIHIEGGLGGASAFLFLGLGTTSAPLQGCTLLVSPILPVVPVLPLSGTLLGTGTVSVTAAVPLGVGTSTAWLQAFIADPGGPFGASATNGLEIAIN